MEKQPSLAAPPFEIEDKTIRALMAVLYDKSSREEQHSRRVSDYCFAIGTQLGLSLEHRIQLGKTGLLHDIGKISIPNSILDKPGSLLPAEWEEIHQHPINGHRFLSAVVGMEEVAETVLAHHERYDGEGYPQGLRGQQIPLNARIVAVADAYDAMVSARPYRNCLTHEEAVAELKRGTRTQFDPEIVRAFLELIDGA
ncbi:MAG: HD-GYP domain-containing protein [Bacillota bacterium]|jgi:HD-GYP domain-containing protein (c-di-GMP phosphodiesterase class II)|nr:HD-GYP domain-containing protein [Bacillota bacterium]NLJ03554.1 HD-GYP domain-containing protein [Bacillota bacterium]